MSNLFVDSAKSDNSGDGLTMGNAKRDISAAKDLIFEDNSEGVRDEGFGITYL